MTTAYVLVAVNIIAIIICHQVAKNRGANPNFWAGLAFFVGPLAIPFVFFSKARGHSREG